MAREEDLEHGFDLWADGITDARPVDHDLRWELSGKDKIAVRLVSMMTVEGENHEFEVGGIRIADDGRFVESHRTADLETCNRRQMTGGSAADDRRLPGSFASRSDQAARSVADGVSP